MDTHVYETVPGLHGMAGPCLPLRTSGMAMGFCLHTGLCFANLAPFSSSRSMASSDFHTWLPAWPTLQHLHLPCPHVVGRASAFRPQWLYHSRCSNAHGFVSWGNKYHSVVLLILGSCAFLSSRVCVLTRRASSQEPVWSELNAQTNLCKHHEGAGFCPDQRPLRSLHRLAHYE